MHAAPDDRAGYVAAFLAAAYPAIVGDLADWAATLEALEIEHAPGRVYATATVGFRGRRYRYRRGVWPPGHPPGLKAGLYATMLTERLLTHQPTATEPDAVADL
jgi:hypothetical protein